MKKSKMGRPRRMSGRQIQQAVRMHNSGYTYADIAKKFGVSTGTVCMRVRFYNASH